MGHEGGNYSNNMDHTTAPTESKEGAITVCSSNDSFGFGLIIPPKRPEHNHYEVVQLTLDQLCYGEEPSEPTKEDKKRKKKRALMCCNKVFRDSYRLMTHLKHEVERSWEDTLETSNNQPNLERVISRCRHCYKEFECPQKLQVHIEVVHMLDNTSTVCRICELEFGQTVDLLEHMRTRHRFPEMPYRCKICEYKTSIHKNLIRHIRYTHRHSAKFHCYFCLFCTNSINSLRGHTKLHKQTKQNKVPCLHCRLVFINKYQMESHITRDHPKIPLSLSKRLKVDKERLDKCWIVATAREYIRALQTPVPEHLLDPFWTLENKTNGGVDSNNHIQNQVGARATTDNGVASNHNDNDSDLTISYDGHKWWVKKHDKVLEESICEECRTPWNYGHYSRTYFTCTSCQYKTTCRTAFGNHSDKCRLQRRS